MKFSRTKIIVAALAITLVAAVAVSQTVVKHHYEGMGWGGGPMGGDPFGGHMLRFFANHLDLTDAQQSQIKDILAKERPTIQLRQIAESGNFDEAKVGSLAAQQSQTLTELIVQKTRIESELFQVLTPEQKTKAQELMNRHEQRFMKHMHGEPSGD